MPPRPPLYAESPWFEGPWPAAWETRAHRTRKRSPTMDGSGSLAMVSSSPVLLLWPYAGAAAKFWLGERFSAFRAFCDPMQFMHYSLRALQGSRYRNPFPFPGCDPQYSNATSTWAILYTMVPRLLVAVLFVLRRFFFRASWWLWPERPAR